MLYDKPYHIVLYHIIANTIYGEIGNISGLREIVAPQSMTWMMMGHWWVKILRAVDLQHHVMESSIKI